MRAKLQVTNVTPWKYPDGTTANDVVEFRAVCGSPFDADGNSEDNTFAKWTPSAELRMTITNPDLFGKHEIGDVFYVDFTKAEKPAEQATP